MAKISFRNLAHKYRSSSNPNNDYALKPLNHELKDGVAYAILGPSGCGKTTLLNIISGILTPTQVSILFDDKDMTFVDTKDRNIAQVFQFPVIYDTMSVRQNLEFPLKNRGMDKSYIDKQVSKIAKAIKIEDILDDKARNLGADAKQKISLGRGLVRENVNVILLDEPLTVIDPYMKYELRTELKALHQKVKHTMIFVTHDQTEALTFADKVIAMKAGEVIQIGTPKELFEKPAHTFVGYFIGSPGMNIFDVKITKNIANINGVQITLDKTYKNLNGKVQLGIRPEFISLCQENKTSQTSNTKSIDVNITRVEHLAYHKVLKADFNGQNINIVVSEHTDVQTGLNKIAFDTKKINIYVDDWLIP